METIFLSLYIAVLKTYTLKASAKSFGNRNRRKKNKKKKKKVM